ncbi:MAG: DUF2188 domain-containing protein [Bacillota bacterium]|nr:DUF2188 domain-containing protein [Bacillota bacterium]
MAEKKVEAKKEAPKKDSAKVYHVLKRESDGMWAIKIRGGKVIKLCSTKAEAEAYVDTLTKNQGGAAVIHASKGPRKGAVIGGTTAKKSVEKKKAEDAAKKEAAKAAAAKPAKKK